ncbi:MAG: DUF1800 domain-containing protein [Gemmatimonadota bacterium]|nr:DUF1800 domain-containing protein [Gemmatimonadota bacterium]
MSALTRATLYITVLSISGLVKAPVAYTQETQATDRDRAIHLLQRATYGPRPADIDAVLSDGISDWLDRQLHPERIDNAALETLLDGVPVASMSLNELAGQYPPNQVLQSVRQLSQSNSLEESDQRRLRRELGEHSPRRILDGLATTRITNAVHSERQIEEMMTAFWYDHFNVFWGKDATRLLVPGYERNAIRPHVFGKFEDMVLATAQHPAMLFYLDNFQSAAPDSSLQARERRDANARRMRRMPAQARAQATQRMEEQQRRRPRPGLNENYARELLELHTLGVDGGYTQADVIDVARILTGWTFGEQRSRMQMRQTQASYEDGRLVLPDTDYEEAYRFRFRPEFHDTGEKTVMGRVFEAGAGHEEGVELIRMLAHHPSTARHIATQLATRFVADKPPLALVDHLAAVFLATSGDLREVTRALFTSDEFYDPAVVGNRVKSPFLLVTSTLRMTYGRTANSRVLMETLRSLGEAPYLAEPPTGYEETSAQWASGGAMLTRMNFATSYVTGELRGVRPDSNRIFGEIRRRGEDSVAVLLDALLPGTDTTELMAVIKEELQTTPPESDRESRLRVLGLILGSPEFQSH